MHRPGGKTREKTRTCCDAYNAGWGARLGEYSTRRMPRVTLADHALPNGTAKWSRGAVLAYDCSAPPGSDIAVLRSPEDGVLYAKAGSTVALRHVAVNTCEVAPIDFVRDLGGSVVQATPGRANATFSHLLDQDWLNHEVGTFDLYISEEGDGDQEGDAGAEAERRRDLVPYLTQGIASESPFLSIQPKVTPDQLANQLLQRRINFEHSVVGAYGATQMRDLSCLTLEYSPCGESRSPEAKSSQIAVTNYPASFFNTDSCPMGEDECRALTKGCLAHDGLPEDISRERLLQLRPNFGFDLMRFASSQLQYCSDAVQLNATTYTAEAWGASMPLYDAETKKAALPQGDCEDLAATAAKVHAAFTRLKVGTPAMLVARDLLRPYVPLLTTMSANCASAGEEHSSTVEEDAPLMAHVACIMVKLPILMQAVKRAADSYDMLSQRGTPRTFVPSSTHGVVSQPLASGRGTKLDLLVPDEWKRIPDDIRKVVDLLPHSKVVEGTADVDMSWTHAEGSRGDFKEDCKDDIVSQERRVFALHLDRSSFPADAQGNFGPLWATAPMRMYRGIFTDEGNNPSGRPQFFVQGENFPFWRKAQTMSMPAPIYDLHQRDGVFDANACGYPILRVSNKAGLFTGEEASEGAKVTECAVCDFVVESAEDFSTAVDVNAVLCGPDAELTGKTAFALNPHQGISPQVMTDWARTYANRLPPRPPSRLRDAVLRVVRPASRTPTAEDYVCLLYCPACNPVTEVPQVWREAVRCASETLGLHEDELRCVHRITAAGHPSGDPELGWVRGRYEIGASRDAIVEAAARMVDESIAAGKGGALPLDEGRQVFGIVGTLAQLVSEMRKESDHVPLRIARKAGGAAPPGLGGSVHLRGHTAARPRMHANVR